MIRFLAMSLLLFAGALELTAGDRAAHQQREHVVRVGVALLTLQSAAPVAPLRMQQLERVLGQMPMGASPFSE
ncbi:hypothetical protein [Simiduia agarivorans]|uniref:Uncharacterized protein n=1 Tax=Simiduia agarivorans (strain DSM 21679 / JCM 13881 / BCRC 17597 / SA1) TaxID=1117647 RepID=K4KJP7_SIMAS|nr:hypothetical protein [Simiduia agarivorans]AFU99201.1 hypothetical protein M5M_10100 [Simiduia agarivorans SA1 = DSM 21679]